MKRLKKWISLILVLVMTVNMMPMTMATEVNMPAVDSASIGGTCGNGLTWTLAGNGTLTVSGSGKMTDYPYKGHHSDAPWFAYKDDIQKIVIGSGVTHIGECAFLGLTEVEAIDIGRGVTSIGCCAFFSEKKLKSVVIPDTVKTVDYSAFNGCSSLTNVVIGSGLTELTFSVFENCSALEAVIIPDNITAIGNSTFAGNTSLKAVVIGGGVEDIDYSAFEFDDALREVYFRGSTPPDIKEYGSFPFGTDITFYYANNWNGTWALNWTNSEFYDEEAGTWKGYRLKSTPSYFGFGLCGGEDDTGRNAGWIFGENDTLTVFGAGSVANMYEPDQPADMSLFSAAAASCDGYMEQPWYDVRSDIRTVEIGTGITAVGDEAFYGCHSLTDVTVSETVETVGAGAFDYCWNLSSVYFKGNAPDVIGADDYDCSFDSGVTLYYTAGTAGWTDSEFYDAEAGTWNGYPLRVHAVELSSGYCGAEGDGTNLRWVLTSDGTLTVSGEGAMANGDAPWTDYQNAISSVVIGDQVTTIGDCAFRFCEQLTDVTFGSSVTAIGEQAFYFCQNLANLTIPDSVETIGPSAFHSCNSLTEVTIPHSVETIGESAFNHCWILSSVSIGDGVTDIAPSTFQYCVNLTELTFGSNVTTIGDNAFQRCESLDSLTIPDSVTTIAGYAFSYCTGLTEVTIPNSITAIADGTFLNCSGLTELTIPDSVETIGYNAFTGTSSLEKVTIGSGVTTIGGHAFYGCGVTDLTLGSSVTTIGNMAFEECNSLESVIIPAGVTSIGEWAFLDGDKLYTFYFEGNAPAVFASESYCRSFNRDSILYYTSGTEGWTDSEYYDEEAGTWNGYKLAVWGEENTDAGPEITAEEIYGAFNGETPVPISVSAADSTAVADLQVAYAYDGGEKQVFYGWIDKFPGTELAGYTDWDVSTLPEGDYELFAIATDTDGNTTTISIGYITVDRTAPTILGVWPREKVALCHHTTMQVLAEDNHLLERAEVSFRTEGGETFTASADLKKPAKETKFDIPVDLSQLPGGDYTVTYTVYDTAGSKTEATGAFTLHPYEAPEKPGVTAEAGYKTATLTWTYGGDLDIMDRFALYACDENGENPTYVTAGRFFQYTLTIPLMGMQYFFVEARDIYGGMTRSDVVGVHSEKMENEPPQAVILPRDLTGTVGTPVSFSGANSTDNDVIVDYAWDFGDGNTGSGMVCDHTYTKAGTYKVQLTVTDESGNENTKTAEISIYDITGENATHGKLTVTVRDAYKSGSPVISNATVMITTADRSFETVGRTDSKGTFSAVVPLGAAVVTVAADGFVARSKDITVKADSTGNAACEVGMTPMDVSVVDGSLKVREMTYEEIVEAGIDVNAPENQQVFEFEVVLEFQVSMGVTEQRTITGYRNLTGDVLPGGGCWGWGGGGGGGSSGGSGGTVEDIIDSLKIGVFPVAENIYLVIYGQAHWLKEMFNVELLVANNSYMYDITDCTATLDLPEGLSLAAMVNGVQTKTIDIGTIGKQEGSTPSMKKANWYICGDDAGEYLLSAQVNGLLDGDPFSASFEADQPVKVYAGEALHLYIQADKYAAKGLTYPVQFELKNVSPKELYNVELEVLGAEFQKGYDIEEIHYKGGNEEWQWKEGAVLKAQTLKPGESLTGEFQIRFAEDLAESETRYMLTDGIANTLSGSTTEVPVTISVRDNLFRYASNYGESRDATGTFFYDDDFFRQSAAVFNPELAYMTICLAAAGYNSTDVTRRGYAAEVAGRNIRDLLTKIGFPEDRIQQKSEGASYEGKPKEDSIAVSLASRPFEDHGEDYTLLAVVVRGGNYELEWHDNFVVGTNEEHKGFSKAANKVMKALNAYIADQNITGKVKVWITGYSRGSATANLVAARIMDGKISGQVTCAKEDLYAYGFATPMGTTAKDAHASRYSTIYSIVSPADFVPMVAPAEWDYTRYGKTYYLPSPGVSKAYDTYHELLKNAYAYTTAMTYEMDGFKMWKLLPTLDQLEIQASVVENKSQFGQEAFLQEFSQLFAGQIIPSAELYTRKYQEAISDLIGVVAGNPTETDALVEAIMDEISDKIPIYAVAYLVGGPLALPAIIVGLTDDIATAMADYSEQSANMNLTKAEALALLTKVEGLLTEMLVLYPNYGLNLVRNAEYIGLAHYQEHYLSWMRLIQSETQFEKSVWSEILDDERGYRKVAVKCPVDVEVYDVSDGTPVLKARIVNKEVQTVDGSSMVAYVDENGQMIFFLPYNGEYEVRVTATDDGEVTYSVTEVNLTTGEETKHAYYGIAVSEGDVLTGSAEDLTDSLSAGYTLTGMDGEEFEPNEVLSGDELVNHTVSVTVEGEGAVMGGGTVEHGGFAKVTAYAAEDRTFVGWFAGETLLSENTEYTTCVREDLELTAKFEAPGEAEVSVENGEAVVDIRAQMPCTAVFAVYENGGRFVRCEVRDLETGTTEWKPDVTDLDLSACRLKVFLLKKEDSKKPWASLIPAAEYPAEQ